MPFDESLAQRIRIDLSRRNGIEEKKMFGSVVFMLNGNLVGGVWKNSLIARIGPKAYDAALLERDVSEFDVTGRPMKGWVLVKPHGIKDDDQLAEWIERSVKFVSTLAAK